jgi:sarcosine oxidase subunit alpha
MPRTGETCTVRFSFDGEVIEAAPGEPIASAIAARGLSIARSPKFHRPRGPACFRSACDGCLARVSGQPNIMTCMVAAKEGDVVESQNTLGSRKLDLLRITDWFFPDGMNHHELFAGVVGVQKVMQIFARRIAGLGRLPAEIVPARAARRRDVDVLVIGGGPSGMAVASRLADAGRGVVIVDDGLEIGGNALSLPGAGFRGLRDRFAAATAIEVLAQSTAVGTFGDDVVVVTPAETLVFSARERVLATGAHDGVLAFAGNDLPGVMSARAAGVMLRFGAIPGARVVVVVSPLGGPFGEAYASAIGKVPGVTVEVVRGDPLAAKGVDRVRAVTVRVGAANREIEADAVLIDAPRAPSYELAEQLGARLVHEPRGYVTHAPEGRVREGVWACGELTGCPLDLAAIEVDADALVAAMLGRATA